MYSLGTADLHFFIKQLIRHEKVVSLIWLSLVEHSYRIQNPCPALLGQILEDVAPKFIIFKTNKIFLFIWNLF